MKAGFQALRLIGCVVRAAIWPWPKRRFPAARFTRTCASTPNRRRRRPSKRSTVLGSASFRYTHDLPELLEGLVRHGVTVPEAVREAEDLTDFAWHARYPGPAEPVTEAEYHCAVVLAERVVEWAGKLVEERPA